jgi:hypothetical protein
LGSRHPPDRDGTRNDEDEDEYLELQNLSAQPVPLFDPAAPTNTWRVRGGVDFDLPAAVTLAAGEFTNALGVAPWERLATVPARASRRVVRKAPMGSDPNGS